VLNGIHCATAPAGSMCCCHRARLRRAAVGSARLGAASTARRHRHRALYALAAQLTFDSGRIVAVIDPEFALIVGVSARSPSYLGEAFERQYARSTFARFVPPGSSTSAFQQCDDSGWRRAAGCTVMFSDCAGSRSSRNPSRWSA